MLESTAPAGWARHILDSLRTGAGYELVLIIAEGGPQIVTAQGDGDGNSAISRAWKRWYPDPSPVRDAFRAAPIEPTTYTSEVLYVSKKEEDIEAVRAADLEVIVNLSRSGETHGMGWAARFGLWAFDVDHGGRASNSWQRRPARISEHHRGNVVATEISVQDGPHRGVTLGRAFAGADPTRPYRGDSRLFWRRATLLMQRLSALRDNGWDYVTSISAGVPASPGRAGYFAVASSMVKTMGRAVLSVVKREFAREEWFIALRESGEVSGGLVAMNGFRVVRPPRDRFYADPFLIEEAGRRYIFVEEYPYALRKGIISCIEIDPAGNCGPAVPVVEAPHHLSYPFLFRWQGQIFMMPEASGSGRVEVYRAVDFPYRWEFHAVLLDDIVGYDPTLLEHEGRFWLFLSGVLGQSAENSDLSVFSADDPFGRWRPHPENPVVSDIRRARPAGAIFRANGQLYRPGQDCSINYGRAITLNRIEALTERIYRETPVGRIEPEWFPGNLGTHTFNQGCGMQVVDGRVLAWRRN